jgi:hypothetical protein
VLKRQKQGSRYAGVDRVRNPGNVAPQEASLFMEWLGRDGRRIRLFVIYPTDKAIVWPGTPRSLQVAGRSARLGAGDEGSIALSWVEPDEKVACSLVAEEGVVPESELIRMAETIP